MCVIKVVIVDNGQSIIFFVLLHKKERKNLVLIIQNLEEHQNYMIGSKVTTILTVFLSMINKNFFGSGSILLWIMGQSAGKGLLLLALVTGGS